MSVAEQAEEFDEFKEDMDDLEPVSVGNLSAIELDGYLTCAAISPKLEPSDWLEAVWDEDPHFVDMSDAQMSIAPVMAHYNNIIERLDDPESYLPHSFVYDDDDWDAVPWAKEWTRGFERAMRLCPEHWATLMVDETKRIFVLPIAVFIYHDGKPLVDSVHESPEESQANLAPLIPTIIPALQEIMGDLRPLPKSFWNSKPGRNDPCSCGSDKKYKKCCGKD